MYNSDFKRTTFVYSADRNWLLKHVIHLRNKKIRDVTSMLIDRYLEDFQDEQRHSYVKGLVDSFDENGYVTWVEFKRRLELDES